MTRIQLLITAVLCFVVPFCWVSGLTPAVTKQSRAGAQRSAGNLPASLAGAQPELEGNSPVLHIAEGGIKLPFLKVDTTPLPDMSSASAVRMACRIGFDVQLYKRQQQTPASTYTYADASGATTNQSGVQTYNSGVQTYQYYGRPERTHVEIVRETPVVVTYR
jgi:hypothetical protein